MIELYDFQQDAVTETIKDLNDKKNPLIALPTGTGKTVVLGGICNELTPSRPSLVIVPQEGIMRQTEKTFKEMNVDFSLEYGKESAKDTKVVLSTVQTMASRLREFPEDSFSNIITDEAHHGVAPTYIDLYNKFAEASRIGCTATPKRHGRHQLDMVYDSVSYAMSMDEAMNRGLIHRPVIHTVESGVSVDKVKRTWNGELNPSQIGALLISWSSNFIDPIIDLTASRKKTILFVPDILSANHFADVLTHRGLKATSIHSKLSKKESNLIMQQFRSGEITHLVNCLMLKEGTDIPEADTVVILRPTERSSLVQQMIGRIVRIADGKEDAMVLDFRMKSQTMKLVTAIDIMTDITTIDSIEYLSKGTREDKGVVPVAITLEEMQRYASIFGQTELTQLSDLETNDLMSGRAAMLMTAIQSRKLRVILNMDYDSRWTYRISLKEASKLIALTTCNRKVGRKAAHLLAVIKAKLNHRQDYTIDYYFKPGSEHYNRYA